MNLDDFNLVYVRKSDRKKVRAKRVCEGQFVYFDEEKNKKVQCTRHELLRDFDPDKSNKGRQKMMRFQFFKKAS